MYQILPNIYDWPVWLSWLSTVLCPGQGTCPGCRFRPWLGCVQEETHRCFSLASMFLFLFLPLPSSLSKINRNIFKNNNNTFFTKLKASHPKQRKTANVHIARLQDSFMIISKVLRVSLEYTNISCFLEMYGSLPLYPKGQFFWIRRQG